MSSQQLEKAFLQAPFLSPYLKKIEKALDEAIFEMGARSPFQEACAYSLKGGGKRFRPLLVYFVAESIKNPLNELYDVTDGAVAVELFHTASLIADDLPCMDNDAIRRGRPSLHKAHGESVAILASLAMISSGYERIYRNAKKLQDGGEVALIALETVTRCAGILGAPYGQFLDLYPRAPSWKNYEELVYLKTTTLFEIAFVLGFLFGGGDPKELPSVKRAAYHLGLAFQIADDLQDLSFKGEVEGSNVVHLLGKEGGLSAYQKEKALFFEKMKKAALTHPGFSCLIDLLDEGVFRAFRA